jgi:hypothetical protein
MGFRGLLAVNIVALQTVAKSAGIVKIIVKEQSAGAYLSIVLVRFWVNGARTLNRFQIAPTDLPQTSAAGIELNAAIRLGSTIRLCCCQQRFGIIRLTQSLG